MTKRATHYRGTAGARIARYAAARFLREHLAGGSFDFPELTRDEQAEANAEIEKQIRKIGHVLRTNREREILGVKPIARKFMDDADGGAIAAAFGG